MIRDAKAGRQLAKWVYKCVLLAATMYGLLWLVAHTLGNLGR